MPYINIKKTNEYIIVMILNTVLFKDGSFEFLVLDGNSIFLLLFFLISVVVDAPSTDICSEYNFILYIVGFGDADNITEFLLIGLVEGIGKVDTDGDNLLYT
jgi:hypothetical protein